MKLSILAAAAIGCAVAAVPAHARDTVEIASAVVAVDDYDLTSPTGLADLNRKIERTAREVCGLDEINRGRHFAAGPARQCYRDAMAKAERRVAEIVRQERLGG